MDWNSALFFLMPLFWHLTLVVVTATFVAYRVTRRVWAAWLIGLGVALLLHMQYLNTGMLTDSLTLLMTSIGNSLLSLFLLLFALLIREAKSNEKQPTKKNENQHDTRP